MTPGTMTKTEDAGVTADKVSRSVPNTRKLRCNALDRAFDVSTDCPYFVQPLNMAVRNALRASNRIFLTVASLIRNSETLVQRQASEAHSH